MNEGKKKPLTIVALIFAISILGFLIILLPTVLTGLAKVIPVSAYWRLSGLIGLYGAVIAFLYGLYQTIKVLCNFYKDKNAAVGNLRFIKFSAISISVLYFISMPFLYLMADKDDAPGVLLFGLIVFALSGICAAFVPTLEKKLKV
ncbi:MAG: DUF2975 domain-containing protein [Clostridiales bacterium]|nr:DUF2975 domain-containing protein [Clostridiales bacterium]